jgi:hypothetical protein
MNPENIKLSSFLESYPVGPTRRNHGLEHATLHVLAQRRPRQSFAGHSDPGGFWILGNVSSEELRSAIDEALARLRRGERHLATHPNCGTNFITAGTLAGLAGALAMFGAGRRTREKLERLPLAFTLATLALMVAQPLGLQLQARLTTSADPGDLCVVEIQTTRRGQVQAHRVLTQSGS